MFGPVNSSSGVNRPFGSAVVDGFDFDFETPVTSNLAYFAGELRSLMDANTSKTYYLSAAPQCVYPDAADKDMLNGGSDGGPISFDFIQVQFYNNYCGVNSYVAGATTQNNYNFDTWDTWAKTVSANPDVKILMVSMFENSQILNRTDMPCPQGIPANSGAAGSGYITGSSLDAVIEYSETFSSFGGIMMWDMSQLYANTGYLADVALDLGSGATSPVVTPPVVTVTVCPPSVPVTTSLPPNTATTLTTLTTSITTTTAPASPTAVRVQQWGQCGGIG